MATIVKKRKNISHLTVGQVEREQGLKLNAPKNTKLSTYLTRHGLPELGKLLEKVESL